MKIIETFEELKNIGKDSKSKSDDMNVAEAWHLWDHVSARYDVIETTEVLSNFVEDTDLKIVLNSGIQILQKQVDALEKLMRDHSMVLPLRPPKYSVSNHIEDIISDRYIFRRVLSGIQAFMPVHMMAYTQTTSSVIREKFKRFLVEEIELFDKFLEYGKLKGWVQEPPHFRS